MPDEARTNPRNQPARWRRSGAVVIAAALTFAACGSDNQQAADPSVAAGQGEVEYGASLEEWVEAVDSDTAAEAGSQASVANDYPEGYDELQWEDLLPPGVSNDEVFSRYEDRLAGLSDGSPEADEIYAEMQAEYDANGALINTELDGAKVNLAGFVAPLNFENDIITEFLLVPYFGACIHVPAPPPNQTVLVKVDAESGISFEESWGAIWVAGTLEVDTTTTNLATASYKMSDATSGVYDEYS